MFNDLFVGLFDSTSTVNLSISDFFICMATGIVLGLFMAKAYSYKVKCSQGFLATLAVLPVVVSMVIIMVNGNIGAGVAVAGAFSLVRFRSVPGTAKEIGAIFTAMCTGFTIGMGYIAFAVLFSLVATGFAFILNAVDFGEQKTQAKLLHITIPESLNYTDAFDDVFDEFTNQIALIATRTTNMGSLFKLSYEIDLKDGKTEKEFIDELRCRNGNLEIRITRKDISYQGL